MRYKILVLSFIILLFSCKQQSKPSQSKEKNQSGALLLSDIKKLGVLNSIMDEPKPGEWLYTQFEKGQSFKQYTQSKPVCPYGEKNRIYITPLGEFDKTDELILLKLREYVSAFYGLETIC